MTPGTPLSARLRLVVLACHALLLLGLPVVAGVTGALLALPLLAPARGLWRGAPYTCAWASMLVLFYLAGFLMEASTHDERRGVMLALSSVAATEFVALLLFVRFRAVEARRAAS